MVAHHARTDDGSPGVIQSGQLAEHVVVALATTMHPTNTGRAPPRPRRTRSPRRRGGTERCRDSTRALSPSAMNATLTSPARTIAIIIHRGSQLTCALATSGSPGSLQRSSRRRIGCARIRATGLHRRAGSGRQRLHRHGARAARLRWALKRRPAQLRIGRLSRSHSSGHRSRSGRVLCHALSRLAARGGRLHCPDDAQTEPREAELGRRAIASVAHRTAGLPPVPIVRVGCVVVTVGDHRTVCSPQPAAAHRRPSARGA